MLFADVILSDIKPVGDFHSDGWSLWCELDHSTEWFYGVILRGSGALRGLSFCYCSGMPLMYI